GAPERALVKASGSNIAHIGLVLGVTALICPLPFRKELLKNDLPVLIFVTLCACATLIDYELGIWDGLLLLLALGLFLFRLATDKGSDCDAVDYMAEISDLEEIPPMSMSRALGLLFMSLVLLLLSSELLVWAVIQIAQALGVSELVIGLTVIAVGTSLPELVVSITSALKGHSDLAMGNIIGSNIFNILAVLSIPSVLYPTTFEPALLWRDCGLMLALTLVLVIFAYGTKGKKARLGRPQGTFLLLVWLAYLFTLYHTAVETA
ncbi:MAG: calcium/sodium antiporter, partial [Pseudomonadales bacterium]|nr:calcium/sodium antiporter [Pseudomonadales bacterium]